MGFIPSKTEVHSFQVVKKACPLLFQGDADFFSGIFVCKFKLEKCRQNLHLLDSCLPNYMILWI